jgi:hypothetical protein
MVGESTRIERQTRTRKFEELRAKMAPNRYDVKTFRYRGQRRSSLMAKVSKRFVNETLWPEYEQLSSVLQTYLNEITERVIKEAIHKDTSEATEIAEPARLPTGND